MATQPTNLPVPSESPRDLKFNAGKIDEFVTSVAQKYIDRFGGEHYTIEGLRQLAQQAIAAFGWVLIDSFQDGQTLTLPNQALRWKSPDGDGEYYRWDGAFPKVVPAGSTPDSTGGIGAGAWVSIGDAALRTMLASSSGAEMIGHGNTTVGAELDKLNNYLVTVNVKDYGAVGDWNATTLLGTDDTVAIQNAINALAALTDKRNSGKRTLFFPQGNYRIKNLVIPESFGFGLNIVGVSRDSTSLYIKPDDPNTIGIDCRIEFVTIDHMSMFGNDRQAYLASDQVKVMWQSKLPDGRADCDVRIGQDVMTSSCGTAFKIYGRGFVMDGGEATMGSVLLEICTDGITFGSSPTNGNNTNTGMRNYTIQGVRFDSLSAAISVTGSGASINYINGIGVIGCDFYQSDKIIYGITATIQDFLISGCRSHKSFANEVVYVKRALRGTISSNQFANWYNRDINPDVSNTFGTLLKSVTIVNSILINGNQFLYNRNNLVDIASPSTDVIICNNFFHNAWYLGTYANIINGANVERLNVSGNNFFGVSPSVVVAIVDPSYQTSPFKCDGNLSSYNIINTKSPVSLIVKHGTSTITPSSIKSYASVSGGYCTLWCSFGATNSGSGSLSLTNFPTAISDIMLNNINSSFSGGGRVIRSRGVNGAISAIVDASTQSITFESSNGSTIGVSDTSSSYSMIFEVTYKITG